MATQALPGGLKVDKGTFTSTLMILFVLLLVYLSDSGKLSALITLIKGPALPSPTNHGWLWNYLFGQGVTTVTPPPAGSSGSSSSGSGASSAGSGSSGSGSSGGSGGSGSSGSGGSSGGGASAGSGASSSSANITGGITISPEIAGVDI